MNVLSSGRWAGLGWLLPAALGLAGCGSEDENRHHNAAPESALGGTSGTTGGSSGSGGNAGTTQGGKGGTGSGGGAGSSGSATGGTAGSSGSSGSTSGGSSANGGSDGGTTTGGTTSGGDGGTTGGGAGTAGSAGGASGAAGAGGMCRKGNAVPTGRCRTSNECNPGASCTPTLLSGGCGFQMQAPQQCHMDADCGDLSICVTGPPSTTGCIVGSPTTCMPMCTETSCGDDGVCESLRCRPKNCDEGYPCPDGLVCHTGATGADARGCAAASCETDGYACPDQFKCAVGATGADQHGCVSKTCSEDGFTCKEGFVCHPPGDIHGCSCATDEACGVDGVCFNGTCNIRSCMSDADCDCGVCVNGSPGQCRPDFFYCSMQVP